ncbi:MAG: M20/M25/M40 family metallo-hydrolase [Candidatus Margulisiibacteriota bacterium]
MINKRRLVNSFKQLVRIDSLSLREAGAAKWVQRELRALGIRTRQSGHLTGGEIGNLIAFVPGQGVKSPRVMINAHLDTVSPGKKIKPVERHGVIRPDGGTILGADNKAGVVAIVEILRVLKERKLKHPPLVVIFTVAEEIGLLGAKVLPDKALQADFGLTLDGGVVEKVVNQAPTQYNLTATIIGRAAHAGIHPEDGVNAIKVASEAIAGMKLGRIDPETTANIGVIKGGKATNIIPDEVELRGEARSHSRRKLQRQVEHMERLLFKAARKYRARLKLKVERIYRSFELSPSSQVMRVVLAGMRAAGVLPIIKPTGGGSDANVFNERGLPTVILGVGAHNVHTTREQIKISDLVRGTEMVLKIITGAAEWKKRK